MRLSIGRTKLWLGTAVVAIAACVVTGAFAVSGGGTITTIAGTGKQGFSGDGGPATKAKLGSPYGVAVDVKGNVYIADRLNSRVRKVSPGGTITTVATMGRLGGNRWSPTWVAVDQQRNVYVTDGNTPSIVRKMSPGGTITNFAGGGIDPAGDGGPATAVSLNRPNGIAVDSTGNVYIVVLGWVRKVTPDGTIKTIAGCPNIHVQCPGGDGGPATSAQIAPNGGVAVDRKGNVYFTESLRVRKVSSGGTITTIAGTGKAGFSGDGGPAIKAKLQNPLGVAVDAKGNVYITDHNNHRVRKVTPAGTITTIAGTYRPPQSPTFSGDGGPATKARLLNPWGVAVDANGKVYIADHSNYRVRTVRP